MKVSGITILLVASGVAVSYVLYKLTVSQATSGAYSAAQQGVQDQLSSYEQQLSDELKLGADAIYSGVTD